MSLPLVARATHQPASNKNIFLCSVHLKKGKKEKKEKKLI
jgi:hypothetical protein